MGADNALEPPGTTIALAGHSLVADPAGALAWPAEATLILADLHLEKAAALNRRRSGVMPALDTPATLDRLEALLARWAPQRVIALGDSFHDRYAAETLPATTREQLAALVARFDWIWIAGNHDPALPAALGGTQHPELTHCGVALRHMPSAEAPEAGEIAGHLHPKVRLPSRAGPQARPCFVEDGRRCILPAFGAYTGGLDCRRHAIAGLMGAGHRLHALGRDRLHTIQAAALARPRGDR